MKALLVLALLIVSGCTMDIPPVVSKRTCIENLYVHYTDSTESDLNVEMCKSSQNMYNDLMNCICAVKNDSCTEFCAGTTTPSPACLASVIMQTCNAQYEVCSKDTCLP